MVRKLAVNHSRLVLTFFVTQNKIMSFSSLFSDDMIYMTQ